MYKILPLKRAIQEQISKLPPAHKQKVPQAFADIEHNPHHHPQGKIGELKGEWRGTWHFELSHGFRIHYEIDENARTITITYVGPHPDY